MDSSCTQDSSQLRQNNNQTKGSNLQLNDNISGPSSNLEANQCNDNTNSNIYGEHLGTGTSYQSMENGLNCQNNRHVISSNEKEESSWLAHYRTHKLQVHRTVFSSMIWFSCYMLMGVFGGAVAYSRFPRFTGYVNPQALSDIGYDIIPYFCPMIHPPFSFGVMVHDENPQSLILLILYIIVLAGVVRRRSEDGRMILQDLLHLNSLIFLTRMTTVGVTSLPQPNPRCVDDQQINITYLQSIIKVVGGSFPPRACGDLIFSGHVSCILICCAVMHYHNYFGSALKPEKKYSRILYMSIVWTLAFAGIFAVITCRSHYTVDAILAFYFSYFLSEFYFVRAEGKISGTISDSIRWLKCHELVIHPDFENQPEVLLQLPPLPRR